MRCSPFLVCRSSSSHPLSGCHHRPRHLPSSTGSRTAALVAMPTICRRICFHYLDNQATQRCCHGPERNTACNAERRRRFANRRPARRLFSLSNQPELLDHHSGAAVTARSRTRIEIRQVKPDCSPTRIVVAASCHATIYRFRSMTGGGSTSKSVHRRAVVSRRLSMMPRLPMTSGLRRKPLPLFSGMRWDLLQQLNHRSPDPPTVACRFDSAHS